MSFYVGLSGGGQLILMLSQTDQVTVAWAQVFSQGVCACVMSHVHAHMLDLFIGATFWPVLLLASV